MSNAFEYILKNIKNSNVEYKYNEEEKRKEPYMIQFIIDSKYKFVIRRDVGYFSHNLENHWHFEVWSNKGKKNYSLYIFVDEKNNVIKTKNYPQKIRKKE